MDSLTAELFLIALVSACLILATTKFCRISQTDANFRESKPITSAFHASRLTSSSFLIIEQNDVYGEHPYIYAKVIPSANTIVLIDTGCGGAARSPVDVTSLRVFLETVRIVDNDVKPLNEGGRMGYITILTHCHYDHILGVDQFDPYPVLASSRSPSFIDNKNLPENSQCNEVGARTPQYTPTLVPHLHNVTSATNDSLGLYILHTPGHTPDELAIWDSTENMLYVGDTVYEHSRIMFDTNSSILDWLNSMDLLINFILPHQTTAYINAGHDTALRPALDVLSGARAFMADIVAGKEVVVGRWERRGEWYVVYERGGGRFKVEVPERLILDARRVLGFAVIPCLTE